jgi:hypothetical protein
LGVKEVSGVFLVGFFDGFVEVFFIAKNWVAQRVEVEAELVFSAGFGLQFYE